MKRKRKVIAIGLLLGLIAAAGLYIWGKDSKDYTTIANLTYGTDKRQAIDLYLPKGKQLPVILYVHGGGWSGGDKENVAEKPAFFTKQGYAFLSMDHRMHPDVTYEEMAQDVAAAIEWVVANSERYQLDTTKINLMGHSSGGHLITLVGTNPVYLQKQQLPSDIVHSLVVLDGPVELESFIQRLPSYKKVFGEDKKLWAAASPITYANQQLPPSFFVTRRQNTAAIRFIELAKQAGNESAMYGYTTISHSEATKLIGTSSNKEAAEMTEGVLQFLHTHNK